MTCSFCGEQKPVKNVHDLLYMRCPHCGEHSHYDEFQPLHTMPAPKGNDYAAKPEDEKLGDFFSIRGPVGLKGRAVKASRARNMKLSPWLIEAIEEKVKREGF